MAGMRRNIRQSRNSRVKPLYPKPRTMYRHLLKQARRLPDPAARYFYQTQIRIQFRNSEDHSHNMLGARRQPERDTQLNTALYHLNRLTRANMGSQYDMQFVVGVTYGFVGPVVAERQKYRRILDFQPGHKRLHPDITLSFLETQNNINNSNMNGVGGGDNDNNNSQINPTSLTQPPLVVDTLDLLNITTDDDLLTTISKHNNTMRYLQQHTNSIHHTELFTSTPTTKSNKTTSPLNEEQYNTALTTGYLLKHLIPHPVVNGTDNNTKADVNNINSSNNNIKLNISSSKLHNHTQEYTNPQYTANNIRNPLNINPHVYQPFEYGQYFIPQHPFNGEINDIIWHHSTLNPDPDTNPSLRQILERKTTNANNNNNNNNHNNAESMNNDNKQKDGKNNNNNNNNSHRPKTLHPNQLVDPEDTHLPLVTRYSSGVPVHPRVQLSFEYNPESFMYSLLYFLSTQPQWLRSCYRSWIDFSFVPVKQEVYDKIFGFDSETIDQINREVNLKHLLQTTPQFANAAANAPDNNISSTLHGVDEVHLPPALLGKLQKIHQDIIAAKQTKL